MGQEQLTFVGLMAAAEAVVAVEILSTDYTLIRGVIEILLEGD